MDEEIKNKRLVLGDTIIYPFTKQENVIGLQKTIKEKLPTVSANSPESAVERQVWIKPEEETEEYVPFYLNTSQEVPVNEQLYFEENVEESLTFGNNNNDNEILTFEGVN